MSASIQLRLPSDVSSITAEQLYQHYGNDFRRIIDSVFTEDSGSGLSDRLRANVSRFAAYKAEYVSAALKRALNNEQIPVEDREKLARAVLHTFKCYQDAERTTATARARTAKQFEEFLQPDNVRLFPNLRWLPSRSADPRATHTKFYDHVWAKDDPFWKFNAPGTEWNCKCDIEETDEPITKDNPQGITRKEDALPGIEGNPAKTGEIFTDNARYIRVSGDDWEYIKQIVRNETRTHYANYYEIKQTSIGEILVDKITIHEVSKGAKTDVSYFYKQEIALNIYKYTDLLQEQMPESIDLSHNNPNNMFYQRKIQFVNMRVFRLELNGFSFRVKMGVFRNGVLNLYSITEPEQ